jgi:serine/threonine-protein kinase HipA
MSYITKRVDRKEQKKIHMEDFCQLSERLTEYKYSASYEKCAKIIDKYSINPMLDKTELFYRLLFCYITGNSDMHLKNFSLIDSENGYVLSPAYDLLPVKIIINDLDDLALTLNGKTRNITKNDFLKFASNIGIPSPAVNKLIQKMVRLENKFVLIINESFLPDEEKGAFINLNN